MKRVRIAIRGAVQGVGFRPFVYRLATQLGLSGWVLNSTQGVLIEAEGEPDALQQLLLDLEREAPPHAFIQSFEFSFLDPIHLQGFEIRESADLGPAEVVVLPDIATCPQCVSEIFAPRNRRYRYPFTNCTHCGPRYSIIESLPYDRANTSMRGFPMCTACAREYEDVADRRFHAQPTACVDCGPHLELWDQDGGCLAKYDEALRRSERAIREGCIVAVKGLGGFHLMANARDGRAVARLRERKRREEKPLAVMYPNLADVRHDCYVSALEQRCLRSPECPIVLLQRRNLAAVATEVAPGNPYLGVLLPYTPLHHLLLRGVGVPVVATSGNLSEEPICTDEQEALTRLGGIADFLLVHDRPIVRHVDDSIVRVMLGRELVLRRARGYAPLPQRLSRPQSTVLAVGAHLKNTVALSVGSNVFLSQHIGDLENAQAGQAFRHVIDSFRQLYRVQPEQIAADMHPDYFSTRFAWETGLPVVPIQHHFAHVVSCMAENELAGEVLGVAWDGTGYGPDGTVWGGEFLVTDGVSFRRAAALRRFRLPGGARAVREPRRSALGALYEIFGDGLFDHSGLATTRAFAAAELPILRKMLGRGINSPWTSSAGRLFDAIASIVGLRQRAGFEGQAAMDVEFAAEESLSAQDASGGTLALPLRRQSGPDGGPPVSQNDPETVVDWEPLLVELMRKLGDDVPVAVLAAEFHLALAAAIVAVARHTGQQRVVLSGGCFQNRLLTECAVRQLEAAGLRPYWHQRIPPNDGGIALGQAVAAGGLEPLET